MRYRLRRELACWTLAEILAAMDTLKIEPAEQKVFATDGPKDAQGVPTLSAPPAYLSESQQRECQETGATRLTLQQQVEQVTTLAVWRHQLYSHGVATYVASLGLAKCVAQLKARKAEMSTWDARMASRRDVEKRLIQAIHDEVEKEEEETE